MRAAPKAARAFASVLPKGASDRRASERAHAPVNSTPVACLGLENVDRRFAEPTLNEQTLTSRRLNK